MPEHTSAFVEIRFNASIVKGLWEQVVAGGDYNADLNQLNLDSSVEACKEAILTMRSYLYPIEII